MIMNGVCVKEEVMSTRVMRQLYTDIAEKYHVPLWVFQGYKWYVTRIDSFCGKGERYHKVYAGCCGSV